ncbi:hypothetical protein DYB36_009564 [Aphanomyces astaci]|uniref:U-box domain-containing protein n=2 Tax=Aphanomyces astaci TaxID=112090 RepID=A0A397BFW8_APHAT|nr:hypothetical protein DYB36_009564 [Aphanomyces astaci]
MLIQVDSFVCPITCDVMDDPVVACDGYSYDRSAIESWLENHSTSPVTNNQLATKDLLPNHSLRQAILEVAQPRHAPLPATPNAATNRTKKTKKPATRKYTQHFIAPSTTCVDLPRPVGPITPVTMVMTSPVPPTMVFMLLNGANDGLHFTWHDGCLHAVGHMAAVALGADADWVSLGIRLYNQQGHIVQDAADVRASGGILHVLLEFQVWVWPGIAVGHTTTIQCDHPVSECEHPPITLTTLSLSPKVFGVSGFVSQDDADAILSQGQPHLDRSRIDDKGVRAAKLARLPSPSFAERTQLVRYAPGDLDKAWDEWLDVNLHANASGIMKVLMESKGEYLPTIVRVWEAKAGNFPHLRYTFPKRRPPHGMSQWYRWVRNTKETIASLSQAAPELIQPYGDLYPKFNTAFETKVLTLLRVRIATGGVTNVLSNDWLAWLDENNGRRNVLLQSWELQVQFAPVTGYTLPLYVPHIPPQRFATLFVYVNSVDAGGETSFPFATSSHAVNRSTMAECNQGLAVPPVALQAALFYVQTPTMEVDEMASHGGCPPRGDNVKWGANQFMWNADAEEGAAVWLDST